jgi:hypothetical protein
MLGIAVASALSIANPNIPVYVDHARLLRVTKERRPLVCSERGCAHTIPVVIHLWQGKIRYDSRGEDTDRGLAKLLAVPHHRESGEKDRCRSPLAR